MIVVGSPVVGIDVSKKKLDAALLAGGKLKYKVVENSRKGYAELATWLGKQGVVIEDVHACMESTGVYSEPVALGLSDLGLKVSMVNPTLVKGFGQCENMRNKNDRADAGVIARYCAAMHPPLWEAPSPELRHLRSLTDRVAAMKDMRQQEENRLEAYTFASDTAMQANAKNLIAYLDEEIKRLAKEIDDHIDGHPGLKRDVDLMTSIPGLGRVTAAKVISRVGDIRRFTDAKKLAAYLGVTPKQRQSGSSVRGRSTISRMGSGEVRTAMYMPAITAIKHNPLIAAFAQRLSANGMAKMAVVVAAMRKLVHQIYGVIRSGQPFDSNYLQKPLAS
ncbi:IS110 family transposase [Massilia sp. YMA4]|uniref:IS110 family transposase n=1 Tax=[Empedobacter] haloabium TaxID=592317 RepID=A0ABZ1UN88_9BURK|nr:IS110 family transposase [Massilia sp. YMA4]AXA90489.1 IS110 family transposase [Massilia sp. YMA4]AXA90601.1 IS110 family transposase [Massilia sp. YMA4]AXA91606.1 IS110 family transposase [Massilia sp. YMA4]AXA92413.1 IS110 family transposase [Massilia sp. YMA4]AXA92443.1 IS110 family transposase [Massilia sp. YMA4]